MNEYLKAQTKLNQAVIDGAFQRNELHRISKSDYRWADNRNKDLARRPIKKGQVYQFEFGKNYIPEMSYEHRGLVIGVNKKLLYVLPIFSFNPDKHKDVYHYMDYPYNSNSSLYLLKSSEYEFIQHDSILKLNDMRTISINRVLYQHQGRIYPQTDRYREIENMVIQKYFPDFYYDYNRLTNDNDALKKEIESLKQSLAENSGLV